MILMMLLGGLGDLYDDGTISSKNRTAAAMIYHPFHMIFLIKSNIVQWYKLKLIEPVINELRPSPKWNVDGSNFS